jgi:hypothetical protein
MNKGMRLRCGHRTLVIAQSRQQLEQTAGLTVNRPRFYANAVNFAGG